MENICNRFDQEQMPADCAVLPSSGEINCLS
jgi:hypothetical protein